MTMNTIAIFLTDYSLKHAPKHGNYAQQSIKVLEKAGWTGEVKIYDAIKSEFPTEDDLKSIKGFWITGSASDAFENNPWILNLMEFIQKTLKQYPTKPFAGICFGHQIISRALGSKIHRNPNGWELGIYDISINEEDQEISELFRNFDNTFKIIEVHQDIVSELPVGYKNIGSTNLTNIQGIYKKDSVLTFQGHPEFSKALIHDLVDDFQERGLISDDLGNKSRHTIEQVDHQGVDLAKVIVNFFQSA